MEGQLYRYSLIDFIGGVILWPWFGILGVYGVFWVFMSKHIIESLLMSPMIIFFLISPYVIFSRSSIILDDCAIYSKFIFYISEKCKWNSIKKIDIHRYNDVNGKYIRYRIIIVSKERSKWNIFYNLANGQILFTEIILNFNALVENLSVKANEHKVPMLLHDHGSAKPGTDEWERLVVKGVQVDRILM